MDEHRNDSVRQMTSANEITKSSDNHLNGLRVLVVDDDDDTRELLKIALTRHGIEVMTADSAGAAVEILERENFDVLLSDIGMPEADGYELISRIRARETQQQTKIIPAAALTAYTREEDRLKILAAGFQMHIPKPVELAELTTIIARLAGRN